MGVIFAHLVAIPNILDSIFVCIIAGVLLYIIVKEFLPEKEKGKPLFFLLGNLLFLGFYLGLQLFIR